MAAARDPEFYLRHADYVRALARHLVFDPHLADDVEQRVWLAALEHAPRDVRSPRAWLKALVRSFAIKAWRGEARRAQREEAVSRAREAVPTPAEIVEHENTRRQLVEALLELDEPYRDVLLLRFFEGLEPRQIAQRLDVPLETVRTHHKRALARMREKLERRRSELGASVALAFVQAWRLEPPSYARVGAAATKSLLQGALIVSVTHKVAIAAAAIVVFSAAFWTWRRAEVAKPDAASIAPASAELEPVAQREQRIESSTLERAESNTTGETPSASATANDARFGSLSLHVIWAHDRSPAAGVWMRLFPKGADDPYRDTLDARTDDHGDARIEHVPAGHVAVLLDRGPRAEAEVEGGRESTATLEIPAGFDVTGSVIDIDGRPFAGADIYLQAFGASCEGFVVARSGVDGSFAIRGLEERMVLAVSARAAGRAPTKQHVTHGNVGETMAMRLEFEALGGALTGRVLAPNGSGVAGARVLIGDDDDERASVPLADGTIGRPPASRLLVADSRGEFAVDGLAPGAQSLRARARGFATWSGEVEIVSGRTRSFDVPLVAGASLSGVVRDAAGAPLAGVEVWANIGTAFTSMFRRTAADGSYAMNDLPLGEFGVEAVGDERGYAAATLFGVSGAELRWDPQLSTGLALRVQLVAPGQELAGWHVTLEERPHDINAYADTQHTDANGRTQFVNVPDVELRVSLRAPGPHSFPRAVLHGVRARDGELVIEPDPALEPTVFLRGRVLDADAKPLGGVRLAPENPALFYPPAATTDATGRFQFGPLPAGEWSISGVATGFANLHSASAHVETGETWDFGDLTIERGGTVVAHVVFAGVERHVQPTIQLRAPDGTNESLALDGDHARSALVAPGRYTLVASGEGLANVELTLEVFADRETSVELVLRKP